MFRKDIAAAFQSPHDHVNVHKQTQTHLDGSQPHLNTRTSPHSHPDGHSETVRFIFIAVFMLEIIIRGLRPEEEL